jgi:CubicO group peptidase (beta-lactamase class C family)
MMHEGKTDCSPKDVGYNPKTVDRLDALCGELIDKGTIQAACYLLARHGKVFAHKSAGRLRPAKDSAAYLPDSLRPVASLTKAFTAVGIWQLLEQGKIFLHQPVREIIKEFDTRMHEEITVFQLLTHTSGLKASMSFLEPYPEPWDDRITKDTWIRRFLSGPLQFKSGTTWNYCNMGFQLLAEIIARVSGMDYDTYIEENILKPLGMADSHFFVPKEKHGRVCLTEEGNDWCLKRKREEIVSLSLFGAGALVTSVPDMYKFGQMLLSGGTFKGARIVGRKTVESGTKAHVKDLVSWNWHGRLFDGCHPVTYGLGLEIDKHRFLTDGTFDHEGAGGILLYLDPKEDFMFAGIFSSTDWHGDSWVSPLAVAWSGIE